MNRKTARMRRYSPHSDVSWAVWDRALDAKFEPRREGDRALRNVLRLHNLVRSGGLAYAVDTDVEAAAPAAEGLRLLGAQEVAEVVARAAEIARTLAEGSEQVDILELTDAEVDELERLNGRYSDLLPTDEILVEIVRRHLDANPEAFDPV